MSQPVISVEHLSKQYDLGVIGTGTLTRDLERWWARIRHKPDPYSLVGTNADESWLRGSILALDDVSFTVQQGEALGIIGKNGAGKSTLLKILSRVTAPTSGVVKVKGRIGSLLEVGTGFHPELTGRENVYLNGAILGMKRAEVDRKFDEIVAFSGVEKFIDTPVKRYSSGMYVRLAFAVAAHLDPEILVVDEVLAVGDAEFQKKCLGKMSDVAGEGRTVLFVSHNMNAISRICYRAIWIDNGKVICDLDSSSTIYRYLSKGAESTAEKSWANLESAPGDNIARLKSVKIINSRDQVSETINIDEPLGVEIQYWNLQTGLRPTAIIHFYNESGVCLFASNDWNNLIWSKTPRQPGIVTATCHIPPNFLAEGNISVLVAVNTYNPDKIHIYEKDVVAFQVVDRTESNGVRGEYAGSHWPGVVRPLFDWDVKFQPDYKYSDIKKN